MTQHKKEITMTKEKTGVVALTACITSTKRSSSTHKSSILWRTEMPIIVYYTDGERAEEKALGFGATKMESIICAMEDFAFTQQMIIDRLQRELTKDNELLTLKEA